MVDGEERDHEADGGEEEDDNDPRSDDLYVVIVETTPRAFQRAINDYALDGSHVVAYSTAYWGKHPVTNIDEVIYSAIMTNPYRQPYEPEED